MCVNGYNFFTFIHFNSFHTYMEDRPGPKHNNKISTLAAENKDRVLYYVRTGHLLHWSSFFVLIFLELFIGGHLSKVLSKENYSVYVNILNALPFYNILVNMGIAYGISYIVSYNSGLKFSLLRQTFGVHVLWYLLLAVIHAVIYFFSGSNYAQALLITMLISFAYSYKLNLTSFFLATNAYPKAAVSNLLQKTVVAAIIISIYYSAQLQQLLNENFVTSYPAIELSVVLFYFIVFGRTNYRALSAPPINYRKRLLKFGKYAMVNNGLNVLYYTIIALIIHSSALALQQQIVMGLCITFFRFTAVAIAPLFSTMSPQFTRIKNDSSKVWAMYKKYFVAVLLISLVTMLGCRFFFGIIITNFYDPSYHDVPAYFNFFCYLIPLLFINALNGTAAGALGKIKYTTRTEIICTALLLLFLVFTFVSPIADYRLLNYMVLAHLVVKFVLLGLGTYKTIKR